MTSRVQELQRIIATATAELAGLVLGDQTKIVEFQPYIVTNFGPMPDRPPDSWADAFGPGN